MAHLVIALDYNNARDAERLMDVLDPTTCCLKVGGELFTTLGPNFVRSLVKKNFKVFLDLKFHDIPNTVSGSVKAAADLGVWMMTVHAFGGEAMLCAARAALDDFGNTRPLLVAVTILTSMTEIDLLKMGVTHSMESQVIHLARLALNSRLDGVVCSGRELSLIKTLASERFMSVVPGVRLAQDQHDDQARVVDVRQALHWGADCLVMGRSITRSKDPLKTIQEILNIMATR